MSSLFNTEMELLVAGIVHNHECNMFGLLSYDIISVIIKFIGRLAALSDEWNMHHDTRLCRIGHSPYKLRVKGRDNRYIKFAFGKRIIKINPCEDVSSQSNIRPVWKLKLRYGGRKSRLVHICCGIGIVNKTRREELINGEFQISCVNNSHLADRKWSRDHQLIDDGLLYGYQCGTYDINTHGRNDTYPEPYGHCIFEVGKYMDRTITKDLLTTAKYCFMDKDIVTLMLDLRQLKLNIYINDNLFNPRYSKSISDIKAGEYSLGIWLLNPKHKIEIL